MLEACRRRQSAGPRQEAREWNNLLAKYAPRRGRHLQARRAWRVEAMSDRSRTRGRGRRATPLCPHPRGRAHGQLQPRVRDEPPGEIRSRSIRWPSSRSSRASCPSPPRQRNTASVAATCTDSLPGIGMVGSMARDLDPGSPTRARSGRLRRCTTGLSGLVSRSCRDSRHWRARRDSNPRPSDPKSDALSTELRARWFPTIPRSVGSSDPPGRAPS
jgi:hypothetical protein